MASNFYVSQLQLYLGRKNESRHVKRIHGHIIRTLHNPETFLLNAIINAYGKISNLKYACKVFDEIPRPNIYSWNGLLTAYSKSGDVSEMEDTFMKLPCRDCVSWNLLIKGYASRGLMGDAVKAYNMMMTDGSTNLTKVTISEMLKISFTHKVVHLGMQIHGQVMKFGFESYFFVGSSLLDMYTKVDNFCEAKKVFYGMRERNAVMCNALMKGLLNNGMMEDAKKLFKEMKEKDSISWTTMINGLTKNRMEREAIDYFRGMKMEGLPMDQFTFGSVLPACGGLAAINEGKEIHALIIRTEYQDNIYVASSLVDMYCKCNNIVYAENVFNRMEQKNVVSWTAMLGGYGKTGKFEEAIKVFSEMQRRGIDPDYVTLVDVISACANIASLEEGSQFHGKAIIFGLIHYISVSNSLITLYRKCGNLEDSIRLFNEMDVKDQISWTAMVSAYAQFGKAVEAIDLFERMVKHRLKPDGVTFVSVISACSRAGLVEKGQRYFDSMVNEYGITPISDHYSCMIDLFSRAGKVEEAKSFIKGMPFPPDAIGLSTLLSACRNKGNLEIGEWASELLRKLDPHHAAGYTLLSSLYALSQKWDCVAQLRREIREKGVKKEPGCSWIKYNRKSYIFSADDQSSPFSDQIYAKLEELYQKMIENGYKPDISCVPHDVEESEKVKLLKYHSERLAIAFGLIFVHPSLPIRVVKNLRVCIDCHNATKHISKVTGREILVRDAVRFHLFKDGICSCGDFW